MCCEFVKDPQLSGHLFYSFPRALKTAGNDWGGEGVENHREWSQCITHF